MTNLTTMPSPAAPAESPCTHCGLPTATARLGDLAFCCEGCRTVHGILQQAGLAGFYDLRDRLDAPASARPAAPQPQAVGRYAHFDDPAFLRDHLDRNVVSNGDQGAIELEIDGLHCAACVWLIERLPQLIDGVEATRVDFGRRRLRVTWNTTRARLSEIAGLLDRLGYAVSPVANIDGAIARRRHQRDLMRLAVAGALAGNVMLASIALYAADGTFIEPEYVDLFEWAIFALSLPAVTYGAWPFYRRAIAGLRMRMLHMDLPVSLGVAGGFIASAFATVFGYGHAYYDTITILVFLLLAGRALQTWGHERVWTSSDLMLALVPSAAHVVDGTGTRTVYSRSLSPGDRIRVPVGEAFPADGIIVEGRTHVDLGLLTGESEACARGIGDGVLAGARNVGERVDVTVERVGEQTRVGRLVATMANTTKPARIVRLADRLSGVFVASVLGLAVVAAIGWWFVDATRMFDVVVALLVVSCPCALGLATPATIWVARARAGQAGLLLRSADVIETLAAVRHLVLDKTGTLTRGRMQAELEWSDGGDWRGVVAALERGQAHPIAESLRIWAGTSTAANISSIVYEPGAGVHGRLAGEGTAQLGSPRWIDVTCPRARARVEEIAASGRTPVVLDVAGRTRAVFALGDEIRDDARAAISRLRNRGLILSIRSGDVHDVVAVVGQRLGITDARGDCSPEAKADEVTTIQNCAMLGDGINDAPALHAASVGIAVSGGAPAAMKVADVYLRRPDLTAVADLFDGAARTMALIRRGLAFSLLYNVAFAGLAIAGLITPLMAAILMPISSATVIANAVLGRSFGATQDCPTTHRPSPAPLRTTSSRVAA